MSVTLETLSQHPCFGGTQGFYRHDSSAIGLPMRFSVYQPPQAQHGPVPVLFYLAGLTCTEETFMIKAGAQRFAAEHGIMLVAPDTSPRGAGIAGETDSWDFGVGAGFYVDATEAPWSAHYRMYSYVVHELRELILAQFPARAGRIGICGHSMGGHGALTIALKNPDLYRSVSAFAPIAAPMQCPWGEKAFAGYLGADRDELAPVRRQRTDENAAHALPAGNSDRPGPGRPVPGAATAAGTVRSRVPHGGPAADAAPPCGL